MTRRWIPRLSWGGITSCGQDDEQYEGRFLCLEWLGWCFEIQCGRES